MVDFGSGLEKGKGTGERGIERCEKGGGENLTDMVVAGHAVAIHTYVWCTQLWSLV